MHFFFATIMQNRIGVDTQDIYSHVLPEMQLEAASAMERILTPAKPEPTQPTPPAATPGKVISFAERAAKKKQTSCA